jgi:thioredoxin-like negative regulator of GroEL
MLRSIVLVLFMVISGGTQILNEPVRLDPEKEAWLTGDEKNALSLLLTRAQSPDFNQIDCYNLGYLYYLEKNFTQAQAYLQKCLAQRSDFASAHLILAKIFQEKGDLQRAVVQLKTGLQGNADDYKLRLEFARIQQKAGQLDRAEKIFLDLLDDYENKIELRVALAALYRQMKKYDQAKELLDNDLVNNPESSVMIERANIYRAMGELDKARDILIEIYHEYPNSQYLQTYADTLSQVFKVKEIPPPSPMPAYTYKIQPDEALDYKVSYSFITLGWVKMRMKPAEKIGNKLAYPVLFYINSNPGIDFLISLHHVYESYIDSSTMNAIRSRLYTPGATDYLVRTYDFDYENGKFYAHIIYPDGRYDYVEKHLPRRAQDSTSILYFARGVVSNNSGGIMTVVIDEEYKFGNITYLNETEKLNVAGQKTDAVKIFAHANFQGVAGMNGDAWGWFSTDGLFKPLFGQFKIIVGSISISVDDKVK